MKGTLRKRIKKILKWIGYFLLIPVAYLIVSLILTFIPVNNTEITSQDNKTIYLTSNGVHLDIVIPIADVSEELKHSLAYSSEVKYLAFGWGDENFYLNTPTWGDLTFKNAFSAMFLTTTSLMHLTRYRSSRQSWTKVQLSPTELQNLNQYINASFMLDANGNKMIIAQGGYSIYDDFYRAHGSYSFLKTCNSWVNHAFKESDLKACVWTPFDFGLINKYE
jgi:uncharacterized protein (TIGR02117 family)